MSKKIEREADMTAAKYGKGASLAKHLEVVMIRYGNNGGRPIDHHPLTSDRVAYLKKYVRDNPENDVMHQLFPGLKDVSEAVYQTKEAS